MFKTVVCIYESVAVVDISLVFHDALIPYFKDDRVLRKILGVKIDEL